ncbi:MAG: hypothetical protein IT380_02325 [Myxococcales bacterium]|nr:hypothetical protein [Myxococcales bacterium]
MPVSKLDTTIRRVASDNHITRTEARSLVKEAKASGSKKPIDDIFKAIDKTQASIEAGATRLILSELDQKMTRAEWVAYAQKAASPSGVWGPGSDGSKKVSREDLPPAVKKVFDKWEKSWPEDKPQAFTFDVAGKPAFLLEQYSEFGTSFGLFDVNGKAIELKEDTKNVQREARRIQAAYDSVFRAPEMKAWKDCVQHTDIGVLRDFYDVGKELKGRTLTDALSADMKKVIAEQKKGIEREPQTQVFKNKKDGSFLVMTQARDYRGPEQLALFNKQGALVKQYSIDT